MTERVTYSVGELAERWGCSIDSIYKLIRERRLPALEVGFGLRRKRYRVPHHAVRDFEASRGMVS